MNQKIFAIALAVTVCNGCSSSPGPVPFGESLVADKDAQRTINAIVKGDDVLRASDLTDERPIAPTVVLRVRVNDQPTQYTVNTVSQAALCLLEVRDRKSTSSIIKSTSGENCTSPECEVCNAGSFGLREEIKRELVTYWLSRLKDRG
jgi:hypothetical protein